MIYGAGGIGKSTAAAYLPAPVFFDVERSTSKMDVRRVIPRNWTELRGQLASFAKKIAEDPKAWEGVRSIVVDSATVCEEFAKEHVIANRSTEKGHRVDSIEGFGWGKGWMFVYEEWMGLLADLDRIADLGKNVCLVAHDVSTPVPNPAGEDFIRWEPHLYAGDKRGRGSIRDRCHEWADHVIFVGYDVSVEDGKARGHGTRSAYSKELPTHRAKSRTKSLSMPLRYDSNETPDSLWRELGIQ